MKVNSSEKDSSFNQSLLTTTYINEYEEPLPEIVSYEKENLIKYGSQLLAILYMVNTMIIPNMNQLYYELDYDNIIWLGLSTLFYCLITFLLFIPCYLVIKKCEQENNPIYALIVKNESNYLYKCFVFCNLSINIIGIFNITVRVVDSIPKVNQWFYITYKELLQSEWFYIVIIIYSLSVLLTFYGLYRISYFEHYYDIQYRLSISFIGKQIINLMVFFLIYFDVSDCSADYINAGDSYIPKHGIREWIIYSFNVICCISYPFFEVLQVKRETRKGYQEVQRCYWIQLLIRSVIFFVQVCTWDLIINADKLKCYYQPLMQSLNALLTALIAMSICPIYAHNYTLNKQVEYIQTATEENNKKQVKQAYQISALLFLGVISILCIGNIFGNNYFEWKSRLFDLMYSFQTICFGFSCVGVSVFIWLKQKKLSKIGWPLMILWMLLITLICSEPLY